MKEILILPILPLCDPAYLVLFSWQVIYRTIALSFHAVQLHVISDIWYKCSPTSFVGR